MMRYFLSCVATAALTAAVTIAVTSGNRAEPQTVKAPVTRPETVEPKTVVLIDGCEYYRFGNNHGDTYAPKMTQENPVPGMGYVRGFNKCYPQ